MQPSGDPENKAASPFGITKGEGGVVRRHGAQPIDKAVVATVLQDRSLEVDVAISQRTLDDLMRACADAGAFATERARDRAASSVAPPP